MTAHADPREPDRGAPKGRKRAGNRAVSGPANGSVDHRQAVEGHNREHVLLVTMNLEHTAKTDGADRARSEPDRVVGIAGGIEVGPLAAAPGERKFGYR